MPFGKSVFRRVRAFMLLAVACGCGSSRTHRTEPSGKDAGVPGPLPTSGAPCRTLDTVVSSEQALATDPPWLAWNGAEYVVFWDDGRDVETMPLALGMYVAEVDAEGRARPERHVSVDLWTDTLVATTEGFATFWTSVDGEPFLQQLSSVGGLVGAPRRVDVPVSRPVWTGDGFGVFWSGDAPGFARLTAEGALISETAVQVPDMLPEPNLVWNGDGFGLLGIAWNGDELEAYFLDLDAAGQPRGPVTLLARASDRMLAETPALLWVGDAYAIIWSEITEDDEWLVRFSRMDRSGAALGESVEWRAFAPSVTWTGSEVAMLVMDASEEPRTMILVRLDPFGSVLGARIVRENWAPGTQTSRPVFGSSGYAAAWSESWVVDQTVKSRVAVTQLDCP